MTEKDMEEVDTQQIGLLLKIIRSRFVKNQIYKNGISLKKCCKSDKFLKTMDTKNYLGERNQLVFGFINDCCDINYREQSDNLMLFTITVTVEMIYFIPNLNLVLSHCFLINLLQSFVSGPKKVSTVNGKVTPGAGYTTYKAWLINFGSNKIQCPTEDVVTYFGNIGKDVIKNYQVTFHKMKNADIISASLHFSLGGNKLLTNTILKPCNWHNKKSFEEKEKAMQRIVSESNNDFRQYRINYIAIILKIIMFENHDVKAEN